MFQHCAVIIPAYNPNSDLLAYISDLKRQGMNHIIVVDDGSRESSQPILEEVRNTSSCILLTHSLNRGKGRALKTAFQYIIEKQKKIKYIVTVDADGQHAVTDVVALFGYLKKIHSGIVLGMRNFDEENVPRKNAFGNKLTSRVFEWLFGKRISDTQTGLRGFSIAELTWLLPLRGERFEYEMNMLMYAVHKDIPIHEVSINTLYFGENHSTHYKTFRDSVRIAKQLWVGRIMKNRLLEKISVSEGE